MKVKAKTVFAAVMLAVAMTVTTISCAPVADAQQYTFQTERREHPNIAKAIDAMNGALQELRNASNDYGGHKATAIRDLEGAIHSAKRALYYRMKLDDAAIERAP